MASKPIDGNGIGMEWWAARHPPADPTTSFAGKTILITGANTGLGFEATMKFAKLGASRLIFGVRSLSRGEDARARICRQTGYKQDNIQLYELDMSVFSSVKTFAETLSKEEPRLDIAILNAGIVMPSYQTSAEGYEMDLQVNALSTALLGALILPQLRKSALASNSQTHLEFVSSIAGRSASLDSFPEKTKVLDQANKASLFDARNQYAVSKLCLYTVVDGLVQATSSWNSDQGGPDVIINSVCPGPCRTTLAREMPAWIRSVIAVYQYYLARTAEEGSRTLVSGAALGTESHGKFWCSDMFCRCVFHTFCFFHLGFQANSN